jgi:hypothetical protein
MCDILDSVNFDQIHAIVHNSEISLIVGMVKRERDLVQRTEEYNDVLL